MQEKWTWEESELPDDLPDWATPLGACVAAASSPVPTTATEEPSHHCMAQHNSQEHVQDAIPSACHPSTSSSAPTTEESCQHCLAQPNLREHVQDLTPHACQPNTSSSASSPTRVENVHVIEGAADKLEFYEAENIMGLKVPNCADDMQGDLHDTEKKEVEEMMRMQSKCVLRRLSSLSRNLLPS